MNLIEVKKLATTKDVSQLDTIHILIAVCDGLADCVVDLQKRVAALETRQGDGV